MKIFDAHNDFLTEIKDKGTRNAYLRSIQRQKVKMFAVVWTSEMAHPMSEIKKLKYEISSNKNAVLVIEDLGFINKRNYKNSVADIIKKRPFYCGLVWNNDNNLGGGCYGKSGLTSLGIKVIKELEYNGIIIDTAHMNKKTFWDFAKITTKPLFNSHCNIEALNRHKRNLDDKQIECIINSGGLVCLSFVKHFLSKKKVVLVKDVAWQIKYFVDNYGYKNLSIGSDFFGTKELPVGLEKYLDFIGLKKELLSIGLSRKVVHCLFYKNLNDFYEKNK